MSTPRNMIGPKLREIRTERGLTQADVASMCQLKGWDLSRETLAKIEGQSRWVADFELVFFANVFGVTLQELLSSPSAANVSIKLISKLEHRVE